MRTVYIHISLFVCLLLFFDEFLLVVVFFILSLIKYRHPPLYARVAGHNSDNVVIHVILTILSPHSTFSLDPSQA